MDTKKLYGTNLTSNYTIVFDNKNVFTISLIIDEICEIKNEKCVFTLKCDLIDLELLNLLEKGLPIIELFRESIWRNLESKQDIIKIDSFKNIYNYSIKYHKSPFNNPADFTFTFECNI